MDSIGIVAWWGAVLSTIVFFWDIFKFLSTGPKLRFSVRTGMKSINVPKLDGKRLMQTEVVNYVERPTTLTNLGHYYYENTWSRLRNRPTKAAVLFELNPAQPLPFELKPGAVWMGLTEQESVIEEWATKGILYVTLWHSHRKKPMWRRVLVQSPSPLTKGLDRST